MTDEDNDALREGAVTVPPPPGDDEDPYGAPTRVARVPDNLLDELMRMKEEAGAAQAQVQARTPNANVDVSEEASELSALAAAAAHVVPPEQLSVAVHMQSGRTVPLSSALLAEVIKSVDDKRARAAASSAGAPNAGAAPIAAVPRRRLRSVLVLALALTLGLSVLAVGVAMFVAAHK